MTTRYSKQREAILNYLENTTAHPTAEMIYEQIRLIIPNISLGTVYRNLAYLVESGQIMKIRTRNETMRFDARIREHYHLQCRLCGKVEDLAIHIDHRLNEEAERQSGAKIDHHDLCFVGICRDCITLMSDGRNADGTSESTVSVVSVLSDESDESDESFVSDQSNESFVTDESDESFVTDESDESTELHLSKISADSEAMSEMTESVKTLKSMKSKELAIVSE